MERINERLREAAKNGADVELRALLRDPECDALFSDAGGVTALMCAAGNGHEVCVGLLLPKSDALAKNSDGMTALMRAAYSGHEGSVRLLLPMGDTLTKSKAGKTALMYAARYGYDECVALLLLESDTLATDKLGLTASSWARIGLHESLAQFINAYTLAQSERAKIEVAVGPVVPRGQAARRV